MNAVSNSGSKWWMAFAVAKALFFIVMVFQLPIFTGCATTVDYQTLHDTTTLIKHDTIPGPAFVRFLAMLNNSPASGIILLKTENPQNQVLFTAVNPEMGKQYIPIQHDSSFVLYASYFYGVGLQKIDSITIPSFKPYSMHTIVLFRTNDPGDPNRLFPIFADDSTRRFIAPKDSCYVRFVNGLPDYPQPTPVVNMYVDDINAPAFFKDPTTGQPSPVSFQEFRNYLLMPVGSHHLFVRSPTDVTQSYSTTQIFVQGEFYTIRLSGTKSDGTDQLNIDSE
ncbi:MAG: hypothetical protein ACHQM6_06190 [Candidatus Kapaibacterium sp.]